MKSRRSASELDEDVLQFVRMCKHRARDGRPAPTNADVASRFGYSSQGSGMAIVRAAEAAGLITVTRFNNFRIVSAADGSWSTAAQGRA